MGQGPSGLPHPLNATFPPLEDLKIEIASEPRAFPPHDTGKPRCILLSNFDVTGGNACLLLEEWKPVETETEIEHKTDESIFPQAHVFVTSARTQAAFKANLQRLIQWLRQNPKCKIEDLAYTTTARRMHLPIRLGIAASNVPELTDQLERSLSTLAGSPLPSVAAPPPVIFVFTGQGAHYAGMGSQLYSANSIFRETVDLCASICRQHGFRPFVDVIRSETINISLLDTMQVQLSTLTFEIALAAYWASVGVQPDIVMGHSLGEYAAFYVSGVISLADTLYLVGERARLLLDRCEANTCAMLTVSQSVAETSKMLESLPQYPSCEIACINCPNATVISGDINEIAHVQALCSGRSKVIPVPYGFHSFQMDQIVDDYVSLASAIDFARPRISVVSAAAGLVVDKIGVFNAQHLGHQTRQPVNFVEAIRAAERYFENAVWIELGPSQVCSSFVKATVQSRNAAATFDVADYRQNSSSSSKCAAFLYAQGVDIDWYALHARSTARHKLLATPSYSWDLKDYWVTWSESVPEQCQKLQVSTIKPSLYTCAQHVMQESIGPGKVTLSMRASLDEPGFAVLLEGHRMQQLPICAGSVLCESAFAAAIHLLQRIGRHSEAQVETLMIQSPVMTRPLTQSLVGPKGSLITDVSMTSSKENKLSVTWKGTPTAASGILAKQGTSYDLGTCTIRVCSEANIRQLEWAQFSYYIRYRMNETIRAAKEGNGHRLRRDFFYSLFSPHVQYGSEFQCVQEAYVAPDFSEAAANVVLRDDPAGTKFTASPFWGEAVGHLAGFTVNANPQNKAGVSFVNNGFTSYQQLMPLQAGKAYNTYVRASHQDEETRQIDISVFNCDGDLIIQCPGLVFKEISQTPLTRILAAGSTAMKTRSQPTSTPFTSPKPEMSDDEAAKTPLARTVESMSSTGNQLFDVIVRSICSETGVEPSELTDDTAVADLGVDSIMAIEVAAKVSHAAGIDFTPSFVFDYPTVGDLRRSFAARSSSPRSSLQKLSKAEPRNESNHKVLDSSIGNISASVTSLTGEGGSMTVANAQANFATNNLTPSYHRLTGTDAIDVDISPQPAVRITLLHERPGRGHSTTPPVYMIADGTGSIASYIHLPTHIISDVPIYGIDSPYLRCPSRLTPKIGIEGIAKHIFTALIQKQTENSSFSVGGFSGGAMIAYEICRQLAQAGRRVASLLLIDMAAPRKSNVGEDDEIGLAIFKAVSGNDDSVLWMATDNTQRHLAAMFTCIASYDPTPSPSDGYPAERTAIIWAQKGMIDRCKDSPTLMKMLAEKNISTTAYPGFMEDVSLGAVAWSLPHKSAADVGPNGWDTFVGPETLLCLSIDADHLEMPAPTHAHLLGNAMEQAFGVLSKCLK